MMQFEIVRLFPKFLLADKNGWALAKAIEAGLNDFLEIVQGGIDTILDVDEMPEWRLDEMAWETNIIYDYAADIESKRQWIRDAIPMFQIYGTPEAVRKIVGGIFDSCVIEEWWEYEADPFHFRVNVTGNFTDARRIRANLAIETAKNARSLCDRLAVCFRTNIDVRTEIKNAEVVYPRGGQGEFVSGIDPNIALYADAKDRTLEAQTRIRAAPMEYPVCGDYMGDT